MMRLAIQGAQDRIKREHQTARFLAWHAVAPHAGKKFPDLKTFMGLDADAKGQTPRSAERLDLDTVMRRWRAVMGAVEAQDVRRRKPPMPIPKPLDGE